MKRLRRVLLSFLCVFTYSFVAPGTADAQWVPTSGPLYVSVQALAASGGNIFAGTLGGGVYLTANNGTSWTAVNNGLPGMVGVSALAVNGGNIFAGTLGRGVYLTANNGTSWTAVNNGLSGVASVGELVANGGNIFAGTDYGVYLTINNGTSWTAVNNGLTNTNVLSLIANGGYVFAGTNGGGVFLTTNNGTSWTRVSNGLTNGTVLSFAVNGGSLFAGTNGGGVFLTTNNGASWSAVNTGLTNLNVYSLTASGGYVFAGTNTGGVFFSANNGTNWVEFNDGLSISSVNVLTASGTYLFAGMSANPGVRRRPLTDVANLPLAPTLTSPANGSTGISLSPTMVWNSVAGAASYRLQVSASSTFSTTVVNDSTITGTSRTIGPLAGGVTCYWRVRAKNSYGTGNWSSVWNFTTIAPPPACVAHWSFDSSSGNTYYDVTGNGYDAIATGSTGLGLAPGVAGQALSCPGSGYEIYAANSSNDFYLLKFTIETWFYSTGTSTGNRKIIAYQYVQSGVRNGLGVYINPAGNVVLNMSDGSGSTWLNATSIESLSQGRWYHLACTYDSA
jgi:hypothetical protein